VNTYERALVHLSKMPRVWVDYCSLLVLLQKGTDARRTFDRALQALPITQHHRVSEARVRKPIRISSGLQLSGRGRHARVSLRPCHPNERSRSTFCITFDRALQALPITQHHRVNTMWGHGPWPSSPARSCIQSLARQISVHGGSATWGMLPGLPMNLVTCL
jgi:hypothetical protein